MFTRAERRDLQQLRANAEPGALAGGDIDLEASRPASGAEADHSARGSKAFDVADREDRAVRGGFKNCC